VPIVLRCAHLQYFRCDLIIKTMNYWTFL